MKRHPRASGAAARRPYAALVRALRRRCAALRAIGRRWIDPCEHDGWTEDQEDREFIGPIRRGRCSNDNSDRRCPVCRDLDLMDEPVP